MRNYGIFEVVYSLAQQHDARKYKESSFKNTVLNS